MSRLGAALERASTGKIVPWTPQAPPEPHSPEPAPSNGTQVEHLPLEHTPHAAAPPEPHSPEPAPSNGTQVEHLPTVSTTSPGIDLESADLEEPRFRTFNSKYIEKLVVSPRMPQALREQYRRLAATMHHAQEQNQIKTIMITSAVPDEGKTLTATNVALTLSESYQRRVLLIDADLRRPSLDEVFLVPKVFGLNEALTGQPDRKVSLIQVSRHLSLLTAGAPDPDPMSALTSDRMRRLLSEAASAFDWVIIDTPPIGILTDANLLGTMVDAALLVIRANRTPAALIQRAVTAIGRNRILGVVLNRAEQGHMLGGDAYYQSYYYAVRGESKQP